MLQNFKSKHSLGFYFVIIAAALSSLIHVVSKPILEMSENSFEINPIYFLTKFYDPLI